MNTLREQRLYALDALRFFAAAFVAASHLCFSGYVTRETPKVLQLDWMIYGYTGVELFFLISGFVILNSARHASTAGEFIKARAVRLYPAFWICCTLSAVAACVLPGKQVTWAQYVSNMTMFPHLTRAQDINGAYWTLPLEVQFYLLIGMVLIFGKMRFVEFILWSWLVATFNTSTSSTSTLIISDYSCYFIGGCACALIRERQSRSRWALMICALLYAMLFSAPASAYRNAAAFRVVVDADVARALVACYFAAVLGIALGFLRLPASWKWVGLLGALSYPIYLLHQRIGFGLLSAFHEDLPAGLLTACVGAAIFLLAWAAHVFAEKPIARLLRRRLQRQA